MSDHVGQGENKHNGDRNFDDLAERFVSNIYGTRKGKLRLDVVTNDLESNLPLKFPLVNDSISETQSNLPSSVFSTTPNIFDSNSDTVAETTTKKLTILDAGGGLGQISSMLAAMGHRVVLIDISQVMLDLAKAEFDKVIGHSNHDTTFLQCSAQDVFSNSRVLEAIGMANSQNEVEKQKEEGTVDLILFHAVVEWMEEPLEAMRVLAQCLKPEGYFSCLFYNKKALVWRNLMNGAFSAAVNCENSTRNSGDNNTHNNNEDVAEGGGGGEYVFPSGEDQMTGKQRRKRKRQVHLTPHNPQDAATIETWMGEHHFRIDAYSGIRMIYDHMPPNTRDNVPYEQLIQAEFKWGREEPYRNLARYIHILGRKGI